MNKELIYKYFPDLTTKQKGQIDALLPLYQDWNSKINVISRKDIDQLYLHHVLHSLAIAKAITWSSGSKILDVGTGGGFPGIPLAILYPDCDFMLCDSVKKKLKVAQEIANSIGLTNIKTCWGRAEDANIKYDYIVSRAVSDLRNFLPWVAGDWRKFLIYLKGGNIEEEICTAIKQNKININKVKIKDISDFFDEDYFVEKKVIFIQS
ncbi:MAG: 16S rRNA (guanine(527)-N(7))-methyltransferase RsmG [Bacteroidales bacterium]